MPRSESHRTMAEFMAQAEGEIDGLISQDNEWYAHLPYKGGLSKEEARSFEIDKRAIWRRVIYDATRKDLYGLRWTTRSDELVCSQCREMEGRLFAGNGLDDLAGMSLHLGCRCELTPVREDE